MTDVNRVRATLLDAISALEERTVFLAPIERLKLECLRMNLKALDAAAKQSIADAGGEHRGNVNDGTLRLIRLDEKMIALGSRGGMLWAENRMLHELLHCRVNAGGWHIDQVRSNVQRSRDMLSMRSSHSVAQLPNSGKRKRFLF